MKNLKDIIQEKLIINKDTNTKAIDPTGDQMYSYKEFKEWLINAYDIKEKAVTNFLELAIRIENSSKFERHDVNDYYFIKYDDSLFIKDSKLDKSIEKKIKSFKKSKNHALCYLEGHDNDIFVGKIGYDTFSICFIFITDKDCNLLNTYIMSLTKDIVKNK